MKFSFRLPLGAARTFLTKRLRQATRQTGRTHTDAAREVRSSLGDLLPRFEGIFVGISEQIEHLQTGSTTLVKDCENLLRIASGRDGGQSLAQETLAVLRDPLAYLDFCQQQQATLLRVLAQCEQQTLAMLSVRARMESTLAPLTYVTMLFKIESARLDDDLRDTFTTVTSEIDRMRQLVKDTFNKNAELLANTHGTLVSVRQNLEREFTQNLSHTTERRHLIDEAIVTLDRQLEENSRRDIQLHTHSRAIADEVGHIVLGLQFQDIVQQKCDHVLSAIAEWENRPPTATGIRLQGLQLDGAASDLTDGSTKIGGGIDRIVGCIDKLDQSSQSLDEFKGMVAASDGMVQRLLDAINEVHEMIRAMATLTERTHESVRPAAELAGSLTSTLVELAINMRLIALNAQIRSVQIGEGTGLEQLASRTAEISRDVNAIGDETARDLNLLRAGINELLETFAEFRQRGGEQLENLSRDRVDAEGHLHALRDRAIDAVRHIGETAKDLNQSADALRESIKPINELGDALTATGSVLHALVGPEEISRLSAEEIATETARYTMASELNTHLNLIGAAPPAPPPAKPADDVDFFAAPAAPVPSATASPTATSAKSSPAPAVAESVEFF